MIIAKNGRFSLRTKTYIIKHEYTTHDVEICETDNNESVYTVATFNKYGELVSCGGRLINAIKNQEDIYNMQALESIGRGIIEGENVISGYKAPIKDTDIWYGYRDADCEMKYFYNQEDAFDYVVIDISKDYYRTNRVSGGFTITDIYGEPIGDIGKIEIN